MNINVVFFVFLELSIYNTVFTIDQPKITVNGTVTTLYETSLGDTVKIQCSTQKDGTLKWADSDYSGDPNVRYIARTVNLTSKYNKSGIHCVFIDKYDRRSSSSVFFKLKPVDKDARKRSQPLQIPNKNFNRDSFSLNVSSNTFQYGDVLEFTCTYNKQESIYSEIYIHNSASKYKVHTNIFDIKSNYVKAIGNYTMNFNETQLNVDCIKKKKFAPEQHLGRVSVTLIKIVGESTSPDEDNIEVPMSQADLNEDDANKSYFMWMYIGGGVFITILVIAIIIIIKICSPRKQQKDKTKQVSTLYHNFSNESSSTSITPIPNEAKLEETYLAPADTRGVYANCNSQTYAQPFVETNIEYLYAKPVPKSKRNHYNLPGNAQPQDTNYLVINNSFDSNSNIGQYSYVTGKNIAPDDIHKRRLFDEKNDDFGYDNVINNQHYVNDINTSEVDGASNYCEIKSKKFAK